MRKVHMKKLISILMLSLAMVSGMALAATNIIVVSHGQANDPFWSIVKNGVDQAAKDTQSQVKYTAPATFNMPEMARLIEQAIAQKPDGIVVSIPDAEALGTRH